MLPFYRGNSHTRGNIMIYKILIYEHTAPQHAASRARSLKTGTQGRGHAASIRTRRVEGTRQHARTASRAPRVEDTQQPGHAAAVRHTAMVTKGSSRTARGNGNQGYHPYGLQRHALLFGVFFLFLFSFPFLRCTVETKSRVWPSMVEARHTQPNYKHEGTSINHTPRPY